MNPYESERLLSEYLLFHYGTEEDILGGLPAPREALHFAERSVTELLNADAVPPEATALDIGCAVGRASFELARHAQRVIGLDFSHSFVQAAEALRTEGSLTGRKAEEGAISTSFVAEAPAGIDPARLSFLQGDAMRLPADLPAADIVLAANLICRLPRPRLFLDRLPTLVKPGGQLLLTTPFTWLEEFTPEENWLGGRADGARSFPALQAILEPHFRLETTRDLPFLIREHARKFQYGVALGSRWIRRD